MSNNQTATKQLASLIEGVRKEAYAQGLKDAIKLLKQILDDIKTLDVAEPAKIVRAKSSKRNPAGHNRNAVERALMEFGKKGARQATIMHKAAQMGEQMAQSSVRHALKQLEGEGRVRLHGTHWRLISSDEETAGTTDQATPAVAGNSSQGGSHGTALGN